MAKKEDCDQYKNLKIVYRDIPNSGERWEKGIPHHPESEQLLNEIMDIDFWLENDYFCWKKGGDGDNGEQLMYILDMIFERRDRDYKSLCQLANCEERESDV